MADWVLVQAADLRRVLAAIDADYLATDDAQALEASLERLETAVARPDEDT